MNWSPEQDAALKETARWLKSADRQVFRLFGYAGTGKTTLARHLAEAVDGGVVFAAFTGKAAHVMRQKGCTGASTIHSLIYRARGEDEDGPTFALNDDSAAADAGLIVIDECSMVDAEVGRDLLSFGKPVLVLGDPAQLPPIAGGGFFTEGEPDVMLSTVHRQAEDNPIVRMSMQVREGRELEYGEYGRSRVIPRAEIDADAIMSADQVLVGLNRTRRLYNSRIRELHRSRRRRAGCRRHAGVPAQRPQAGPRQRQRVAGEECPQAAKGPAPLLGVAGRGRRRPLPDSGFDQPGLLRGHRRGAAFSERRKSDEFDFGYALTVHKAQGSQWGDVVLFNESTAFREHRSRWLYTGITRAAERLTVVQ